MTTIELIRAEIENVPENELDELYEVVKRFAEAKGVRSPRQAGALSKLRRIQIDAPADFAANLDLYLSGEKKIATDQDAG
jgi:hypothetical protein